MFAARVLYSEVIANQAEDNGTGSIVEETRSVLCLYLTLLGEMLDKSIIDELLLGGLGTAAALSSVTGAVLVYDCW